MTARIVGVRGLGERQVTFALFEGEAVRTGQRVLIREDGRTRNGIVVIAPEQLLEYHAPQPRASADIDEEPAVVAAGESTDLLNSLNLPQGLLKPRD